MAKNAGGLAPDRILIEERGQPTRDPDVMYREPSGALLPFGGHKGYALAGALSGGPTN